MLYRFNPLFSFAGKYFPISKKKKIGKKYELFSETYIYLKKTNRKTINQKSANPF